ncbi:hypothetical protein [Paraburkholderia tropica]|uniref:hypothetical protein n=1 Tax=Paraburkholderia tropica TaxID=92647 RepID=UPI003D29C64A
MMKLLEIDEIAPVKAPRFVGPAIYFLFLGDEIVYIGASVNFAERVGVHAGRYKNEFDGVAAIPVPEGVSPLNLEYAYIAKYRPRLNSPRAYDLALDENGRSALDRAMIRLANGESPKSAAMAENLTVGAVRAREARDRRKNEADQLLFSSVFAV